MRVYYLTSGKWALEAIKLRRLKVSRFGDLNDPFELLPVDMSNRQSRKAFNKLKEDVNELVGPICFSKSWTNPVLWSHYGDKHKGICLGFDILDEWAYEIKYFGSRIKDELEESISNMDEDSFGHELLTIKFEHWKYEEEVRIILNLKDMVLDNGLYFLPFCNALKLRDVIIGPRCNVKAKDGLKILSSEDGPIKIFKSRLAFRCFEVVRNKAVKIRHLKGDNRRA